jgi:hypothetical protein
MKLKIVDIITNLGLVTTDGGPLDYGPWEEVKVVVGNARTGQAVTVSNTEYEAWHTPLEAWRATDWVKFDKWLPDQELEGSTDMGRLFIQAIEKFNELNRGEAETKQSSVSNGDSPVLKEKNND